MTTPSSLQDLGHPSGFDYEPGSPHLRHASLRRWIVESILRAGADQFRRRDTVRVLEVGAGHGSFTDHVLAMGASVTVTEMSRGSADFLQDRYRSNAHARVIFDATGDADEIRDEQFDLVLCISVLHHIPDYLTAIARYIEHISPGGAFLSFQDPLWYPDRSRRSMALDRGAYFAWRLGRGDLVNGLHSIARRAANRRDESNPRDMVENHVLRDGCNQNGIAEALAPSFRTVDVVPYWSTQAAALQTVGAKLGLTSSFAVLTNDRRS